MKQTVTGKTVRKRELRPDSHGRYRPYIGKRWSDGQPVKFNLGTDRREAERRYARIQDLYLEAIKLPGMRCEGHGWLSHTLAMAQNIATGKPVYEIPLEQGSDTIEYQRSIEFLRRT